MIPLGIQPVFKSGPDTSAELTEIEEWKKSRLAHSETAQQFENKRRVYLGTLQFLSNEGLIRIVEKRQNDRSLHPTDDPRINSQSATLLFVLTGRALMQLNMRFSSGTIQGQVSLFAKMKEWVLLKASGEGAVSGAASAGAGFLITKLLGG